VDWTARMGVLSTRNRQLGDAMTDRATVALQQAGAARHRRSVRLSPDELRIVAGLAAGRTYRAIATEVGLAPATIAYHANRLQQRLGVGNNVALVAIALVTGILLPGQWPPALSGVTEVDLPG
jgi:DNA-binding NarL/FixJ family response regulator